MSQMPEQTSPPVSDDKIAAQQAIVDKLAAEYAKNPSPELLLQLKRRSDTLLHVKNLAKPDAMERARLAAEKARISALSKAITQRLG